jgi:hypothetical protein
MPEFIKTAEVIGNVAQRAYGVGKFVMKHVQVGGWGETATDIQPPHVNIEPTLGEE